MSFKLSNTLKGSTSAIARTIREYEKRFPTTGRGKREKASDYKEINDLYYDVVTDFYEFGWGRSFHFAPRVPGETFNASLARHEHYLAHKLGLRTGMVVADIGCGVGGPLLEIARFSGARIVGVNSNAYQLEHARKYAEEAELAHLAEFMHCDFLNVNAPDGSFDAAYSIEATCCAPDKLSIYGEIFRLLKPGARCWRRGISRRRPVLRFPGTNHWSVQGSRWRASGVRGSDARSPRIRSGCWRPSASHRRDRCRYQRP